MEKVKYSKQTIWIHWLSALIIFGLIYTGINMENSMHTPAKFSLYKIHFTLGISLLLLTIIRMVALTSDSRPKSLYPEKSIHQKFIKFVQYSFYVVLMWMCISGILSLYFEGIYPALQSGNFSDLPEISADGFHPIMLSHHIVAKFVFLLLIFHVVGFFIHLFRKKENTLKRIWF